jgi:hypothetical protein
MEQNTKKILITTGIIAALSLVAYKLLAKNKNTGSDMPLLDKTPLDVAPPIEDISIYDSTNQPSEPSESSTAEVVTYSSQELADMLQKAFDGNGTNWSAGRSGGVVGVLLQLKSDEDFDNLNAAYGIRTIKAGFLTGLFAKPFVGDMNGAFNSELSKREIAMANEILSKKGVTRRIELLETNKKD